MNARVLLVLLLLMLPLHIAIKGVEAKDVLTSASELKEVYRKGEEMVIYVSVFNNHSGTNILNITEVNTTIWRIEKRYNRWRNIERVYSRTREIGQLINPGEVFSIEIRIKLDYTPARYNITVCVITKFTAGAAGEVENYVVKGHLFWIKSAITIPTIVWAIIADVILMVVGLFIYRRLR